MTQFCKLHLEFRSHFYSFCSGLKAANAFMQNSSKDIPSSFALCFNSLNIGLGIVNAVFILIHQYNSYYYVDIITN